MPFTNRSNILRTLFYHSHTASGSLIEFNMDPFHMKIVFYNSNTVFNNDIGFYMHSFDQNSQLYTLTWTLRIPFTSPYGAPPLVSKVIFKPNSWPLPLRVCVCQCRAQILQRALDVDDLKTVKMATPPTTSRLSDHINGSVTSLL